MTEPTLRLRDLVAVLDKLPAKEREFAEAVMTTVRRQGLATEGQSRVLRQIYARATTTEVDASLTPLVEMIRRAMVEHGMKKPTIRVRAGETELVVKNDERRPGGLVVWKANMGGLAGTIDAQGAPNLRDPAHVTALRAFACDPVKAAKAYAEATARCCYCAKELTHPASLHAGYGPDCAEHYGLPWGKEGPAEDDEPMPFEAEA